MALEAHAAAALVAVERLDRVQAVALLAEALLAAVLHIQLQGALMLVTKAMTLIEFALHFKLGIAARNLAPQTPDTVGACVTKEEVFGRQVWSWNEISSGWQTKEQSDENRASVSESYLDLACHPRSPPFAVELCLPLGSCLNKL